MMIISAVAGIMLGSAILAPPNAVTAPLVFHKYTQQELDKNTQNNLSFYGISPYQPGANAFKLPTDFKPSLQVAFYFRRSQITCLAQKAADGKTFAKIWVDWNEDKKVQASEMATFSGPLSSKNLSEYAQYNFKGINNGPGGPVYAKLIGYQSQMIGIVPTACAESTVSIDGKEVKLTILDSDYDGRFGSSVMSNDRVMVGGTNSRQELPLNSLMSFPDGRYYSIKVASNGRSLTLTRDESPLGTIEFNAVDVQSLTLTNGKDLLYPTAKAGVVSVPAGSYDLSYVSLKLKGKDNESYSCSFSQAPKQKVVVKGNEQTTLDFTGPLELTMTATNAGAAKQFSLSCKTSTGFPVTGLNKVDQKGSYLGPVKAPQLVIIDPDGNEVVKQDFTFG